MKPFGRSYLLDMYNCRIGSADDLELIYRFLEELVVLIKMTPTIPPLVIHGPKDKNLIEIFPDKAGVSGAIFLIESGIMIHSVEPKRFITLDIYTCGELDTEIAKEFARKTFEFEHCEEHFIERGTQYHI